MTAPKVAGCLALALALAGAALAGEQFPRPHCPSPNETSNIPGFAGAKDLGDTICLIGPPEENPQVLGTFETPSGAASWNGWTHLDNTQKTQPNWHADT